MSAVHDDAKIRRRILWISCNTYSIMLKHLELHSSNGAEVQRREWLISLGRERWSRVSRKAYRRSWYLSWGWKISVMVPGEKQGGLGGKGAMPATVHLRKWHHVTFTYHECPSQVERRAAPPKLHGYIYYSGIVSWESTMFQALDYAINTTMMWIDYWCLASFFSFSYFCYYECDNITGKDYSM